MKTQIKTIKYLFGLVIFSSTLIINVSTARAFSAGTLVSMTNDNRSQNGLGALATNSALTSAAYAKANDILERDYFAHNSPDGKTPWDFINESGYSYAYAGENLAIGYTSASELFSAWMASATHRDNILNINFREIGVAVVSGEFQGVDTIVAVQEFGAAQGASTENSSEQVASQEANPEDEVQPSESTEPTPASPANESQSKGFEFVKEKSDFSPKTIFAGEEITFTVTITGEVKTLEAQVFDTKYNILETSSLTGSEEKTYILKQKITNDGSSEVRVIGVDKNGNSEAVSLGALESKQKVLVKEQTQEDSGGFIAGFKESLRNYWLIYTVIFCGLILAIAVYFISKKSRFENLLTSWRF